jgi:hypothetical protein
MHNYLQRASLLQHAAQRSQITIAFQTIGLPSAPRLLELHLILASVLEQINDTASRP